MVILKIGDSLFDDELNLLIKLLSLLDIELKRVNAEIKASRDPESDGFLDVGEFLIGSGFVAIQRYLTATRAALGIQQVPAYDFPPMVNETAAYAKVLNALANYWKHSEEWFEILNGSESAKLGRQAESTIETLEKVCPLLDYPCADFLAILLQGKDLELSNLLPLISEWRDNLWNHAPQG